VANLPAASADESLQTVLLKRNDIAYILWCLGRVYAAVEEPPKRAYIEKHNASTLDSLDHSTMTRPKIVCLCGSSRFVGDIAVKAWELEKQGYIAVSLHLLPSWYEGVQRSHQAEHEGVAAILDHVHFAKIDLADMVYVMNVHGYIGERTGLEIEHAKAIGKPIEYLVPIGAVQ